MALAAIVTPACAARPKSCVTADEASKMVNKDVCITAHVYEVIELADGTRFLDICTPETPDERCRFTIVSFFDDRNEVGELRKYRDVNVRVRIRRTSGLRASATPTIAPISAADGKTV